VRLRCFPAARTPGAKRPRNRTDRTLAAIATRQRGVVSAGQLAVLGIDRRRVSRRVQAGRLHRVYRGVFAVGHPVLSKEGASGRKRRRNLIVHRSLTLTPADVTSHRGIPVTTPTRTIEDLRQILAPDQLRKAIRDASSPAYFVWRERSLG
jgi:hypothetical protein